MGLLDTILVVALSIPALVSAAPYTHKGSEVAVRGVDTQTVHQSLVVRSLLSLTPAPEPNNSRTVVIRALPGPESLSHSRPERTSGSGPSIPSMDHREPQPARPRYVNNPGQVLRPQSSVASHSFPV